MSTNDDQDDERETREPPDPDADLVTVATYHTAVEAELARAQLEAAGIPSFAANAGAVGVMPFLGNDLGGIQVQVNVRDVEAARDILGVAEGAR